MAIKGVIEQIAAAWPSYHEKGRVDHNDPTYSLVVEQFPEVLRSLWRVSYGHRQGTVGKQAMGYYLGERFG
jgi:hypothetical protein